MARDAAFSHAFLVRRMGYAVQSSTHSGRKGIESAGLIEEGGSGLEEFVEEGFGVVS
jgi:hypothetical protein